METTETRSEQRNPTRLQAKLRRSLVRHPAGLIFDLSSNGCQVEHGVFKLQPGDTVVVTPEGLAGIEGVVRWNAGTIAGIWFSASLHPAVVDHLCASHPHGGSDLIGG